MSLRILCSLFLMLCGWARAADTLPREITLETKKVGEVVHWWPEKVVVHPGETIRILAKHDLEGGFEFHGLLIPALKITEKVDRHKPFTMTVKVPADLKVGEYKVGCQFHPGHVAATLVVQAEGTAPEAAPKAEGPKKKSKSKKSKKQ